MTRAHRSLHRIVWPILAVLVALGVLLALWLRPPPDHAAAPATGWSCPHECGLRAVQWSRDKLVYDAILLVGVAATLPATW